MELFNVYSLYPVEPVRGLGSHVYDREGREYLDLPPPAGSADG